MKRCVDRYEVVCKYYPKFCKKCLSFREETNIDWIWNMTEKELVEFVGHNSICDRVQGENGNWCNDHNCPGCLEEWLKQPAEGD